MNPNVDARSKRMTQVMAALLSLALVAVLVLRVSDAAFSATSQNTGSHWTASDVALTDDSDTAMFAVTNIEPGDTATE